MIERNRVSRAAVSLAVAWSIALAASAARAATEGDLARMEKTLQARFEGTHVTVLIDMPASAKGVDITPEAEKPLNLPDYQARVKKAGISVKRGESIMVTKVKVKSTLIEFQLGGGGYGTFFDEKAGTTWGTGENTKEERRTRAEEKQAEALDKERIRDKALSGGSRFNIRYPDGVPSDALSPESVMGALAKYVEFEAAPVGRAEREAAAEERGSTGTRPPGRSGLHKGATPEEVAEVFGAPVSTSRRTDGGWDVTTNRYRKGSQSVEATFIEGVLVRYTLSEE